MRHPNRATRISEKTRANEAQLTSCTSQRGTTRRKGGLLPRSVAFAVATKCGSQDVSKVDLRALDRCKQTLGMWPSSDAEVVLCFCSLKLWLEKASVSCQLHNALS